MTLSLLLAVVPVWSQAEQPAPQGEALTGVQAKELEKSAKTAADHERLAAYYHAQLAQAQKNLADAQELEKEWGPAERSSKVPDPYPHARRLVREYSAEVEKDSKLVARHQKMAQTIETTNAVKGKQGQNKKDAVSPTQDGDSSGLGPIK